VAGSLDKKVGRRFYLLNSKRLHLLSPLLYREPGIGHNIKRQTAMAPFSESNIKVQLTICTWFCRGNGLALMMLISSADRVKTAPRIGHSVGFVRQKRWKRMLFN
jgi:hypothetical protein